MKARQEQLLPPNAHDAIDSYFDCITACSLGDEGLECVTHCVGTHLKEEVEA